MPKISCPGIVQTDASGYAFCSVPASPCDPVANPGCDANVIVAWEEIQEFDLNQLETADLGGAFAAGFVVVGTAYVIGLGARTLIRAIKAL